MNNVKSRDVVITAGSVFLEGMLAIPDSACGMVVFAHGSGSSRFSRRNQDVARRLNESGLATLLFDLLSQDENERDAVTAEYRFDIPLLAERLTHTVGWLAREPGTQAFPVGLFGASTGAAAGLIAAAERPRQIRAVVSRGGRPDLAGEALGRVRAPTLLIVGGADGPVIGLNELAATRLTCPHQLVIVPGATHLFEEPGALEQVSRLASDWFREHFRSQLRLATAAGHNLG